MQIFGTTILSNLEVATGYYELEVEWPETAESPQPGQFLTVRCSPSTDPLLRRPFAFSAFDKIECTTKIIYQKRGKATAALAAADPGDHIDVLGPLGNVFPTPESDRTPILIAGGVGVGPILYFVDRLSAEFASDNNTRKIPICVFGARSDDLLPLDALANLTTTTVVCTDNGSRGIRGTVIDGLASLPEDVFEHATLYACGPNVMMAAVHAFAEQHGLDCWVSMEQVMGCAVGACMGCAIRVRTPEKYARVCTEGPVFNASEIVW